MCVIAYKCGADCTLSGTCLASSCMLHGAALACMQHRTLQEVLLLAQIQQAGLEAL